MGRGPDYAEILRQADVVLRSVTDGVTVQAKEGGVVYANDAAARLCGFPDAETFLATPVTEILGRFQLLDEAGSAIDPATLPGRRVLAGETVEPMLIGVRQLATGTRMWSFLRSSAIKDENGVPVLAINIWHDVTAEQREKEAANLLADVTSRLSASLDYETTLASVADVLVPCFADYCCVDLLDQGERKRLTMAHRDPKKLELAKLVRERYPAGDDDGAWRIVKTGRPELYRALDDEQLSKFGVNEDHARLLREIDIRSVMMVPIEVGKQTEGTLTLVSSTMNRYDERDLALACELARRAGTAIENARAYRAATDAIRVRDEFLAVAGHELRTPLGALVLQIDSLRHALRSGALLVDPARYGERLDGAVEHAGRLSDLIDELLDVSRITAGRLTLERGRCDLSALVRTVCDRFFDQAQATHTPLVLEAPHPCEGEWDAHRLDQVIANLVSNALKYGAGRPVRVACAMEKDVALIRTSDEGIGIAPENHARIFDRFERAVTDRRFGGLGIGLWVAREIVVAHGGSIDVESAPNRGATFTVALPRHASST